MDLAEATGQDGWEITLDGEAFRVSPLTLAEWGGLQAWIKANVPHPVRKALEELAECDRDGVPVTPIDRQFLLAEARREARAWPPRPRTPEWLEALRYGEGDVEMVLAVLRKHRPDLARDRAAEIATRATGLEVGRLLMLAIGVDPVPDDPKAPGGPPSSAGSPPRRTGARSSRGSRPPAAGPRNGSAS